jgi:hypothetical protein
MAKIREAQAQGEAETRAIREQLRRAIRLGAQEARNERRKRRELDDKFTQLAASHLLTEEVVRNLGKKIDSFIEGLRRSGNGTH